MQFALRKWDLASLRFLSDEGRTLDAEVAAYYTLDSEVLQSSSVTTDIINND